VAVSHSHRPQRSAQNRPEEASFASGRFDRSGKEQTADDIYQREETAEHVRRILKTLPTAQYEVVVLKHWEDLTFAEIAAALGKSQNTVASRYRYAMEKLQRSLEPIIQDSSSSSSPSEESISSQTRL
jgi:RNA polymerase sigma factor (sigma-70 family)